MKSRSEICIPRFLKHEGGFVNHPRDPGKATNMGITIATFRRYIKRDGTVADLKRLTAAQAGSVFKRRYWDAVQADLLPVGVDYAVADYAINSGPSRAAKALQSVVGVATDGQIGPNTLRAVGEMPPRDIVAELTVRRMAFLTGLRTWPTFRKGWTSRVKTVQADAMRDIVDASIVEPSAPPAVEVPKQNFWAAFAAFFRSLGVKK